MTSVFMLEKYHYYPVDSATCTHKFVHRAVSGGVRRNWSGGRGRLSAIGLMSSFIDGQCFCSCVLCAGPSVAVSVFSAGLSVAVSVLCAGPSVAVSVFSAGLSVAVSVLCAGPSVAVSVFSAGLSVAVSVLCAGPSVPACSSAQFQCGDGSCVDVSKKCDKYNDCADGSDEQDCGMHIINNSCHSEYCLMRTST